MNSTALLELAPVTDPSSLPLSGLDPRAHWMLRPRGRAKQ